MMNFASHQCFKNFQLSGSSLLSMCITTKIYTSKTICITDKENTTG